MDTEQKPKQSFYDKERYQKNKEEMLKYSREKYRTQHNKDFVNIEVFKGTFTLYLIRFFFCVYYIHRIW
jgi:hypothetical protein